MEAFRQKVFFVFLEVRYSRYSILFEGRELVESLGSHKKDCVTVGSNPVAATPPESTGLWKRDSNGYKAVKAPLDPNHHH